MTNEEFSIDYNQDEWKCRERELSFFIGLHCRRLVLGAGGERWVLVRHSIVDRTRQGRGPTMVLADDPSSHPQDNLCLPLRR